MKTNFKKILILSLLFVPILVGAQEIDLLWQGDTYAPPFYKSRALWTNQSDIIIQAIPHIKTSSGGELDPTKLVYKWWKNSVVLGDISGVGKNSITFSAPIVGRPQNIKIEILNNDGEILGSASKEFTPISPSLVVYEDSPLYGIMFNKEAGDSYGMSGEEINLIAFPLFFSATNKDSELMKYSWQTNSKGSVEGSSITLRAPSEEGGRARITVQASNEEKITQSGEKSFLLKFNEK